MSYVFNMYGNTGMNVKNKHIIIFRNNVMRDRKIPATKRRRYRYFRWTGRLGAEASP